MYALEQRHTYDKLWNKENAQAIVLITLNTIQ